MDKYKKFMYIGIFILLISLVSSAGTYAWFTWISPSNTSVTLSIGNLADVTFTSGPDINISNLAPVYNYTDGVSTTFVMKNNSTTNNLNYEIKLDVTSISNELKNESFKYTLFLPNGSTVKYEGLSRVKTIVPLSVFLGTIPSVFGLISIFSKGFFGVISKSRGSSAAQLKKLISSVCSRPL